MGLVMKKEEHDEIDDIEVIGRSDTPDDLPTSEYDLIAGKSAEDIAARGADGSDGEPEGDGAGRADGAADGAASDADDAEAGADDGADAAGQGAGKAKRRHGKRSRRADGAGSAPDGGDGGSSSDGSGDGKDGPDAAAPQGGHGNRTALIAAIAVVAVVAVVVAAIVGYFVGAGGFGAGARGADSASLTEDQLDTVVASYTYNGATTDITARTLIESQYSLDAVKQDDGTYATPTADTALNYVRNQILLAEADARGISVSDEEMADFAETTIGTSDYATMAEQYNLSEDQAKEVVRQQTTMRKLYDQIVPETTATVPTAPTEPENGDTSTRSQDYATYIIGLLGDEWDSSANTWASEDGPFYAALSGTDFTADSASYEEALTAYYTAYQQYAESSNEASSTWSAFENGLFANADIELYGLFA